MKPKDDISADLARSVLDYCPETGEFLWRDCDSMKFRPHQVGRPAGYFDSRRRRVIEIRGSMYFGHRLAWLITHGRWPSQHIDHINRDPSDNRLANLREATPTQNQANRKLSVKNKTGFRGVRIRCDGAAFCPAIRVGGKTRYLGSYATAADASEAYKREFKRLHGEFALLD